MLQDIAAETPAPETTMDDVELPMDFNTTVMSVAEPEPEPAPEDMMPEGEQFEVEEDLMPVLTVVEEVVEIEEPREPTKKELKAIEKYNAAVDTVVQILQSRFTMRDALPLNV